MRGVAATAAGQPRVRPAQGEAALITLNRLRNGAALTAVLSGGLLVAATCAAMAFVSGPAPGTEGPAGAPALLPGGAVAAAPAVRQQGISAGCGPAPYGANFYAPAFGHAKTVALTFDDGPGPTTPGIIAVLRAYGVPATFFNIGQNAAAYPSLVRAEAAGHGGPGRAAGIATAPAPAGTA